MPTRAIRSRRWSQHVTDTSHALDLESNLFNLASPRAIAESLKRSAEQSTRRKAEPFRSALSMLVFYINRAGKNLSVERRRTLEKAKDELRALFGRPPGLHRPPLLHSKKRNKRSGRRKSPPRSPAIRARLAARRAHLQSFDGGSGLEKM